MEKTRVPEGEKYWYLYLWGAIPRVTSDKEGLNPPIDAERFAYGNYFPDRESAETMAKKLSAVLKGAEVIEKWQYEEIKNTLQTALATEYSLTGLDSEKEIKEKIAKNETCLARMLKSSIKIMEEIESKIVK